MLLVNFKINRNFRNNNEYKIVLGNKFKYIFWCYVDTL